MSLTSRQQGAITLASGGLLMGTIGIFVEEARLDAMTMVFFRCLFGFLALAGYCAWKGFFRAQRFTLRMVLLAVLSGLLMVTQWVWFFDAIHRTSIAVATVVFHVQPFWVVLMGAALFNERLGGDRLGWIATAFVGLVLASGVATSENLQGHASYLFGVGEALAGAVPGRRGLSGVYRAAAFGGAYWAGAVVLAGRHGGAAYGAFVCADLRRAAQADYADHRGAAVCLSADSDRCGCACLWTGVVRAATGRYGVDRDGESRCQSWVAAGVHSAAWCAGQASGGLSIAGAMPGVMAPGVASVVVVKPASGDVDQSVLREIDKTIGMRHSTRPETRQVAYQGFRFTGALERVTPAFFQQFVDLPQNLGVDPLPMQIVIPSFIREDKNAIGPHGLLVAGFLFAHLSAVCAAYPCVH
jgi:uncharacterized membrane protein